ncbi:hypothetical protein [Bradyrhizobium sp. USDA 3364]
MHKAVGEYDDRNVRHPLAGGGGRQQLRHVPHRPLACVQCRFSVDDSTTAAEAGLGQVWSMRTVRADWAADHRFQRLLRELHEPRV